MEINIGYDFNDNKFIAGKEKIIHNKEKQILEIIIDSLKEKFGKDNFKIEAKSDDYLTLLYKNGDIVRIKYSDRSKWISIFIPPKYRKEFENDMLFETQKNKNQLFWKSTITENNIGKYLKYITIACLETQKLI